MNEIATERVLGLRLISNRIIKHTTGIDFIIKTIGLRSFLNVSNLFEINESSKAQNSERKNPQAIFTEDKKRLFQKDASKTACDKNKKTEIGDGNKISLFIIRLKICHKVTQKAKGSNLMAKFFIPLIIATSFLFKF